MGRPRELSEAERQKLLEQGFKPVEMWVPDWDNPAMRARLEKEAAAIREADEKDDIFEWLAAVHAMDNSDDHN